MATPRARFAGGAALILCGCALAQKTPEVRVSSPGSRAQAPALCSTGDNVYVAWVDFRGTTGRDVYFAVSTDRGRTWPRPDVRLNSVPFRLLSGLDILCEGDDVYVVWGDDRSLGSDIFFNRSSDAGATWLAQEIRLDTDPAGSANSYSPRLGAAGNNLLVVWGDGRDEGHVLFNRSLDGGATWLASAARLTTAGTGGLTAQPQISSEGSRVYVAWDASPELGREVHFSRSMDGGASWLDQPIRVDRWPRSGASNAQLASSGPQVYVIWTEDRGYGPGSEFRIFGNRSTDSGQTWLASQLAVSPPTTGYYLDNPRLAAVGRHVYAVWEDIHYPTHVLFSRSANAGLSWHHPVVLTSAGEEPEICVEGSVVNAVWTDQRFGPGSRDPFFNRSTDGGVSWLSRAVRLNTSGLAYWPCLGCTRGNVHVAWSRDTASIAFNIPYGPQPYGTGLAGTGGFVPQLAVLGTTTVGSAPLLETSGALGGAPAALLIGGSAIAAPFLGASLLVGSPLAAFPILLGGAAGVPGAGRAATPVPIPANEAFVGVPLFLQALVIDAAAAAGVAMSDGEEAWIG